MPDHMRSYLDFEKPVAELDSKVDELRTLAASGTDISEEIGKIEDKAAQAEDVVRDRERLERGTVDT